MLHIEIPDKEIMACTSAKGALRMSVERSANNQAAVAIDLGITESHLSRALNSNYDVTLRHDLIIPFMASCGNAIYLRWLFLHLQELLPELDCHHRPGDIEMIGGEIEELKLALREAVEEIKKAKTTKPCGECGASFALAPLSGVVPAWLVTAALWIDFEMGGDYE
jgi:hypothetical protein